MFVPIRLEAGNPGPMTGAGNATFLLIGDTREATLIDAGVGAEPHLRDLDRVLADHHADLVQVLVTHAHPDHIGGVDAIADRHPRASFAKFPGDWMGDDGHGAGVERPARMSHPIAWRALGDGDTLDAGGEVLTVLHTPGHAPDHLAFWHEPSATIFTGDLVVAGSSVAILFSHGGDLAQYLASLERLRRLNPRLLYPAHGDPVADPDTLLRKCIEHRLLREKQVIAALADGHDTVPSIADCIYDGLAPALLPAARDTVHAHLEKLRRENRAVEHDGHWRTRPRSRSGE